MSEEYKLFPATFPIMVEAWPFVRRGLLTIKKKDKRSGNWTTEHVRAMLEAGYKGQGTCELWIIHKADGSPVGFIITSIGPDIHLGVPLALFVWISFLEETAAFDTVLGELEKIARARGLRYVEGMSSRRGWSRKLEQRGFETHMVLYRKSVWSDES